VRDSAEDGEAHRFNMSATRLMFRMQMERHLGAAITLRQAMAAAGADEGDALLRA
jgi:hypothetical protein